MLRRTSVILYPFYVSGSSCGGCTFNTTLPVEYTTNGGVSYANTVGDICTFAVIDSGQSFGIWPHQAGPSIGILVKYREVGTYGPDFGAFKLVVADIINRNATPLNWPVLRSVRGLGRSCQAATLGGGDMDKGFIYIDDGVEVYGQIGLPSKGSYWPDGTKTDPMYNGRINDNPTEVYPRPAEYPLDSLYQLDRRQH